MRVAAVLLLALGLCACLADDPAFIKTTNQFSYKEVAWSTKKGTNSVSGKIEARGSDGKLYPCEKAWLRPDSAYRREVWVITLGYDAESSFALKKDLPIRYAWRNWGEESTVRETPCSWFGSQLGRYSFRNLPDGVWYLSADGGPSATGYTLMRRVELRGGEKRELDLP